MVLPLINGGDYFRLFCRAAPAPSSERHLLSEVAPTLSLKTPCYGVFACDVRWRLHLGTLAFDSNSHHFACND